MHQDTKSARLIVVCKRTLSYLSVFDSLASFLRYFSFFDMHITHAYDVVYGE